MTSTSFGIDFRDPVLERSVLALRINRRAPRHVLDRAQRAIDRADVMIGALPGVISMG